MPPAADPDGGVGRQVAPPAQVRSDARGAILYGSAVEKGNNVGGAVQPHPTPPERIPGDVLHEGKAPSHVLAPCALVLILETPGNVASPGRCQRKEGQKIVNRKRHVKINGKGIIYW